MGIKFVLPFPYIWTSPTPLIMLMPISIVPHATTTIPSPPPSSSDFQFLRLPPSGYIPCCPSLSFVAFGPSSYHAGWFSH
ncbi:hypothetical protein SESBI_38764 [Sesbania bispinosa]|nr:hypothetical protein SESBI_38764 [Sesbania bispinosa]